jgi:hypothetical protein
VHNLRENFERALEEPISVMLVRSILEGARWCELLVSLDASSGVRSSSQNALARIKIIARWRKAR